LFEYAILVQCRLLLYSEVLKSQQYFVANSFLAKLLKWSRSKQIHCNTTASIFKSTLLRIHEKRTNRA